MDRIIEALRDFMKFPKESRKVRDAIAERGQEIESETIHIRIRRNYMERELLGLPIIPPPHTNKNFPHTNGRPS